MSKVHVFNAGLAAARQIVSFFSTGDIKCKVNI